MTDGPRHPGDSEGRLTLTTLGSWSLSWTAPGGAAVLVAGPAKPFALLVYLALSPGKAGRREHLLDLLWADLDPDAARHALRQTIWQVKRRMGAELVVAEGDKLVLHPPVGTDRDAFLAAVEAQQHERAVALYTGDFLPGFAAPGGADFERWADLERDRLRSTFLRVAEAAVHERLDAGRARDGVVLARRVRDAARPLESGWRLLLEALAASGDTLGAAVEADALDRLLVEEQREPEPATRAAIRLARGAPRDGRANGHGKDGDGRPAAGLVAELVGREREFSDILRAWESARAGTATHVHVIAPPGLGKTRLLSDVHARLRPAGARSVLVRANPGERLVGFAVAGEIARALAGLPGSAAVSPATADTLLALNPSLSATYPAARADAAVGEEALRRRTIALTELARAVADEAPLALLVDDVHWADAVSRQVLNALVAHLQGERVLVVTTSRPTPHGLVGGDGAVRILLEPLSQLHVAALVTSLGQLPDEPWASDLPARLHAATGGSPLLVLETLQLALEHRWLALAAASWSCAAPEPLFAALSAGSALTTRIGRLDRDQRWLLLVLSAVGSPVPEAALRRHLGRDAEALGADLATLEQRGFVSRVGDSWSVAHDEIAAVAIGAATPEAVRAAHLAVGRAAAAEAGADPTLMLRAGQLLSRAGSPAEAGQVFRRWLVRLRQRGDARPAGALAAEFLGAAAGDASVRDLAASLSLPVRMGLYTPARRVAAAVAVLLAGAGVALALAPRHAPPDTELIAITRAPGGPSFQARRVEIRADRWVSGRVLDATKEGRPYPRIHAPADWETSAAYSTARDAWAVTRVYPGVDVQDFILVHADGREERITDSPGGDVNPNWAPDGTRFAFCTARWSDRSWYHVAVVDLATRAVRQLTNGTEWECDPRWSLDGSRIAYLQTSPGSLRNARPARLCWVTVDGADGACIRLQPPFVLDGLSKWLRPSHIAAVVDSAGSRSLASVDVTNGAVTIIRRDISTASVSPDGQWALGSAGDADEAAGSWLVFPLARPDQAIEVRFGATSDGFVPRWGRSFAEPAWVDRVVAVPPEGPIPHEAPYQLRAHGITASGDTVRLPVARWWSGDTTVAVVSAGGVLRGVRHGELWAHVTAGGWRSDSIRIAVRSSESTEVVREDWRGPLDTARWVAYGVPTPVLTHGPRGERGLWSRGDGSFASGVYSAHAFSAIDGLGAEALLSSPVTASQWQLLSVTLDGGLDVAALPLWDRRTGPVPRRHAAGGSVATCAASVPGGEGARYAGRIGMTSGGATGEVALPAADTSGAWFRVRVQIFPDGRCGVALDGRPIWIGRHPVDITTPFHLVLGGSSVGNRMLFGPVEGWQGVKGDVDWSALGRPRPSAPAATGGGHAGSR